jgi:hypothetical protein
MAYTYEELKGKNVQELRDIAKGVEHEAVQGALQMNKEHLLPALCTALGIDAHEHHAVVGINKPALKAKMRELKQARAVAIQAHDGTRLKGIRRQYHNINRQIRGHLS